MDGTHIMFHLHTTNELNPEFSKIRSKNEWSHLTDRL